MKRQLLVIAVFLVAGAVVNVAVAWGCALWAEQPLMRVEAVTLDDAPWPRPVPRGWPPPTSRFVDSTFGTTSVVFETNTETGRPSYRQALVRWGWPLRGLESELRCVLSGVADCEVLASTSDPFAKSSSWAVPTRPIWLGFAVNTLLYATVLWLLICGPFVLRRFIRVKRGRCPACGYPRGEAAVCTECGTDLPKRATVIGELGDS